MEKKGQVKGLGKGKRIGLMTGTGRGKGRTRMNTAWDTAGTGRNSAKHPQSENFSTNSGKETANELLLGLQRPVTRTGTPEGKQTLF